MSWVRSPLRRPCTGSSAGRAEASEASGRRFDPCSVRHLSTPSSAGRVPGYEPGGRGFDPLGVDHFRWWVAQPVEQRIHSPKVGSSSLPPPTISGKITQSVEYGPENPAALVRSQVFPPFSRTYSSAVEHPAYIRAVGSSILSACTIFIRGGQRAARILCKEPGLGWTPSRSTTLIPGL